jgi:HSP20 family protein
MAGNATLTEASSETTRAPSAERRTGTARVYYEGKDYFVREVVYGAFERSVTLPEGVNTAEVTATYANGMLEVRVPAPRPVAPRMIEVTAA